MLKKLINKFKAKKEHNPRITSPLYDLDFNNQLELRKAINKEILLHNLMEATNTSPDDLIAICNLDKAIEDGKAFGMITELYTRPDNY
jgi:hypothetical protein